MYRIEEHGVFKTFTSGQNWYRRVGKFETNTEMYMRHIYDRLGFALESLICANVRQFGQNQNLTGVSGRYPTWGTPCATMHTLRILILH